MFGSKIYQDEKVRQKFSSARVAYQFHQIPTPQERNEIDRNDRHPFQLPTRIIGGPLRRVRGTHRPLQ